MNKSYALNAQQQQQYDEQGYLSPIPVFSAEKAKQLRAKLEAFEATHDPSMRLELHLLQRWAWDVAHSPQVVDPVVSLLGPNVLLWSLQWFIKEPGQGKIVSLHQDANYWGQEPHDVLTAWIALSPAPQDTGPMQFLGGSHKGPLFDHDNTYAENNLLSRGQTIKTDVAQEQLHLAALQAGEMSLHHIRLIHGSGINHSSDRRIGMVLRFCATHVQQTKGDDTAVLVAGEDAYGHFELLTGPSEDGSETQKALHLDAVKKLNKIVMAD